MRKRVLVSAISLMLALAPASLGSAMIQAPSGKLDWVGKFPASFGTGEVDVATYTQDAAKVGLLGVAKEKRASFAFHSNDWGALIQLFHKATQVQSVDWQFVGTLKETGTKDPTLLLVTAGGPGVRFTLETAEGSFAVVLGKGDYDRFDTALRQVTTYFGS